MAEDRTRPEDLDSTETVRAAPDPGLPQRVADRYAVKSVLGRGGFGSVYLAHDELLDREVALKVLHLRETEAHEKSRARHLAEARTIARLDHPNIVPIFDAGLEGTTLWLAMRRVEGSSLRTLIRSEGPLAPDATIRMLSPIAHALEHAHGKRIVHRDVKPSNILIERPGTDEEHAWLVDFGIAKIVSGQTESADGRVAGTPSYMAPEQIVGRRVDGRTDVFALGCVVSECLCGSRAFGGSSFTEISYKIVHEEPSGFELVEKTTNAETAAVVRRALAKSADDRFPTPTSFTSSLAGSLKGRAARASRGFWGRLSRPSRGAWDGRDVLVAEGVAKSYGWGTKALDGFDLRVPRGSIFAMLGRNGTGKTTAIRTFLGLFRPDRGHVEVFGRDPSRERHGVLSRIGYVPESSHAFAHMTVEKYFGFLRAFYPGWNGATYFKLLERFDLPLDVRIRNLSRGMQTKVSLVAALARRPDFLVLDDPTLGLDVVILEEFFETLREVCSREGTTALIASHNVDELEQIATHVAFLEEGRTRLSASLSDLLTRCRTVELTFDSDPPGLGDLHGLHNARVRGRTVHGAVLESSDETLRELGNLTGVAVTAEPMSLKEIFLSYMK